ncbi:MAG: DUF6261 family protein [Tannerellaceae bacterium]|jgi:hypothetical protein|nr:DUF6261 family protein [Tannerellaceae bacterium]
MKQIGKFISLITHVRNAEHYEFYRDIVTDVDKPGRTFGNAQKLWINVKLTFGKEEEIYKRHLKAAETIVINTADEIRLDICRMIRLRIESGSFSFDPAEKAAATKLRYVLDNYKNILNLPMVDTTAYIYNMIEEFELPIYAASLTALDLTDAIAKLKEANDDFNTAFKERNYSIGDAERLGSMKDIRAQMDKVFSDFVDALNASYTIAKLSANAADMEAFGAIIDIINDTIRRYHTIYSRRSHTSSPSKGGSGGDNGDDTIPEPVIPTLVVDAQTVPLEGQGKGAVMKVIISNIDDMESFATLVDDEGAELLLKTESQTDFVSFPVEGLAKESIGGGEHRVIGLNVGPREGVYYYKSPFSGTDAAEARLEKDGILLATLSGIFYPETVLVE